MVTLTSWLKYYLNIILMGYISHCIRDLHRDYEYLSLVVNPGRLMLYERVTWKNIIFFYTTCNFQSTANKVTNKILAIEYSQN